MSRVEFSVYTKLARRGKTHICKYQWKSCIEGTPNLWGLISSTHAEYHYDTIHAGCSNLYCAQAMLPSANVHNCFPWS